MPRKTVSPCQALKRAVSRPADYADHVRSPSPERPIFWAWNWRNEPSLGWNTCYAADETQARAVALALGARLGGPVNMCSGAEAEALDKRMTERTRGMFD
jgi:hypothetical protein